MVDNPRGFVEHRNLAGRVSPITRIRRVKADGASGSHQKFSGDPVVLVSGNTIARYPAAGTAASLPVLGVIRSILNNNKRPLTHNLPSTGHFLPASTAGWVEVNEDPHCTFLVNTDATVTSTLIGQFVDSTAGTPTTAAGRSGFSIEVGTGTNTAGATVPFQVVEVGFNNLSKDTGSGLVGGEANQDVEVIIARHAWHDTNKIR